MIKQIHDYITVVRWILNSQSDHKESILKAWSHGKLACYQLIKGRMPHGFVLWHWVNGYVFVDYIQVDDFKYFRRDFDEFLLKANGVRMMTTRPKAWGRLLPGFKPVGTIMQKETVHESIHESGDSHIGSESDPI